MPPAKDKEQDSEQSTLWVAVIGVGVGFAVFLAAPLAAGLALSAIGFTTAGTSLLSFSLSIVLAIQFLLL